MIKFTAGPAAKFFVTPAAPPEFSGETKRCIKYGRAKGGVQRCKKFGGPGTPTCKGLKHKNIRVGRRNLRCGK